MTRGKLGVRVLGLAAVLLGAQVALAYYSPALGRFLNRDPLEEDIGGLNLYRYVGNAPINAVDPMGGCERKPECKCCCCCIEDLKIENIASPSQMFDPRIDPTTGKPVGMVPFFGNSFDAVASLKHIPAPNLTQSADCTFQWWEYTNAPGPGAPQRQWYDAVSLYGRNSPTLDPWFNRTPPCPGAETVRVTDYPGFLLPTSTSGTRVAFFAIRALSAPNCDCANKSKEVCAMQRLTLRDGQPVGQPEFRPVPCQAIKDLKEGPGLPW